MGARNLMHERRVVRGSTFAAHAPHATHATHATHAAHAHAHAAVSVDG